MLKYAVIGTGWITQSFIDGANLDGGMELTGVYSRSEEKGRAFAEKNGAENVYTSPEALASSDADAVYIASPNSCHAKHTEMMLNAGKHVICEKPITVTPSELMFLQNLASDKNLVYTEAIMYMFNPVRDIVRSSISGLGNITSANIDFSQLSSKYPAYKRGELPNIFNPSMATGCLEDLGIYCVYPAIDLFGMPRGIKASSAFMESGADGSGSAALLYDNLIVNLTYSKLGQSRACSQIFGDEGTMLIESISQLTNIRIIYNDGSEKILSGDKTKAELMCHEATGFRNIIENREKYKAYYDLLSSSAMNVSKVMEKIRSDAGIEFDYKPLV